MEKNSVLVGSDIHGFHTMEGTTSSYTHSLRGLYVVCDLDFGTMMEEAKTRWLRPNEIHAVLCNYKYFTVYVKPMNLPKSGTVVLFDRKKLRNFRKDGHKWKKKKDGKTVKEAHEHLKVGNDERIHVYYAHGEEDNSTFVRRCYWLLDKYEPIEPESKRLNLSPLLLISLDVEVDKSLFIFLKRMLMSSLQGSPATPVNSNPNSAISDPPVTWPLSEESDSAVDPAYYGGSISLLGRNDSMTIKNHEQRLHEINTLDWDELLVPDDPKNLNSSQKGEIAAGFEFPNQYQMNSYRITENVRIPDPYLDNAIANSGTVISGLVQLDGAVGSLHNLGKDGSQAEDCFGGWITCAIADSPESVGDQGMQSGHQSFTNPMLDHHHQPSLSQIFSISDISPACALSTEETKVFPGLGHIFPDPKKWAGQFCPPAARDILCYFHILGPNDSLYDLARRILIVGSFNEGFVPHAESKLYLACGDSILAVEVIQAGVFRCLVSPQAPGLVNLYLTLDGHKPISQVLTFEFRAPPKLIGAVSYDDQDDWEEFKLQMRLARLLFSSSKGLSLYSTKPSQMALKEAKAFARKTTHISEGWVYFGKMIEDTTNLSFPRAKDKLFELTLQNRLHEWLLEKVVGGCKVSERDEQGQGVIHLCAVLGYTWAVYPFSWSGLSLDYRDKFGWTALHWAAYYGREKMVATLLSAGAKPNLVTDPTPQNPGGCTAADLASKNGYDGLAAYLAEKGLVAQFNDMTLAGNVSGSLQTTTNDAITPGNFTEDELYLKDTLTAYRTAADAAARIQAAFREHSFNVRTKAVEIFNPEMEARNIVAAMKIQHAFRNYESRKKMAAAARIQYRFRSWKIRKDFLNMRRQAIRIQALFRGFQARKQYRKIVWSVGVLEKAILRWRLKRKGFRGLQVQPDETLKDLNQESDVEEDFFQASRKQAEERVERSVIRVQAMFRSKQAQEEYRRMKLEHSKAKLEYEGLLHPDFEMG
ncbi:calmodulin-binding transcription activator 5 [Phtheirospermum japonicum]|uniref:Calmodulin-binding transcription activator 5 n=1 Tax=Phtheirospermum japonicum TaxID=374723 RepID=A0A830CIP7_9LAMI|nr:calmodulin-binding transcription activator 5 [Phtheirospermum japonicum]